MYFQRIDHGGNRAAAGIFGYLWEEGGTKDGSDSYSTGCSGNSENICFAECWEREEWTGRPGRRLEAVEILGVTLQRWMCVVCVYPNSRISWHQGEPCCKQQTLDYYVPGEVHLLQQQGVGGWMGFTHGGQGKSLYIPLSDESKLLSKNKMLKIDIKNPKAVWTFIEVLPFRCNINPFYPLPLLSVITDSFSCRHFLHLDDPLKETQLNYENYFSI